MRIFYLFLILFSVSIAPAMRAWAGERHEFYNGVRALGMGGASVAVVNDETALLSNPAALGKLRNYFLTVADPELDLGADSASIADNDTTMFLDPQKTLDQAKLNPGLRFHQRAQLFPSFVVTNFGFGVYAKWQADAMVDAGSTTYDYFYRNDYAFVFGFDFRLFDGRVKFGINARGVNRVEADRSDILLTTTGMDFETKISGTTVANEGFGVGSDIGLILTAPWKALPTLAVVYRDAGTTSYDLNKGMFYSTTSRPDRTPATLDAGISISPIIGKKSRMTITAEMVDTMDVVEPADQEDSDEVMRRVHAGLELNFADVFFLRGGLNQGYWTAGLEIAIGNTQFQLASYGEEVADVAPVGGATPYDATEDRRYVMKFSYRF